MYAEEAAALCERGETLLDTAPPGDALFGWLRDFVAHVAAKRDLALSLADDRDGRRSELFDGWHAAMHATASELLGPARRTGTVHPEITVADLLTLANGIALAGSDDDQAERLLRIIRNGTRGTPAADGEIR